jgi:hypothetical protein
MYKFILEGRENKEFVLGGTREGGVWVKIKNFNFFCEQKKIG